MTLTLLPRVALVAFAAAAAATPALAQQQKLVPAQSEIVFVSKQMGVPVEGRFQKFDARVAFDPKKPETANIAFSVDLGSAALGAPETEAELVKPSWFNVPKFPQATFQSTGVKPLGGGKFEVAGKLNIKGNARDLVVPVTLSQSGATTNASGAFTLKRLDFKIGEGEWADTSMVANDVQVKFKLALTGVGTL
ncbi:YceI family protein [Caldimonas brevitalea]|uniref:Polyisoprenoid-binding protein n=1 Tax=Caldimonas brevitalea TaxID=413882 RepID=A0A0G3BQF1_9BURK|nr:YceI family protein [Caldimonas brevitalea]AKJ31654.1 polyisoprenoid-binding protein [Caldimonas brevitalea]